MPLELLPTTLTRHELKDLHTLSPCSPPASAYAPCTDLTQLSPFGTELPKNLIVVLVWSLMLLSTLV